MHNLQARKQIYISISQNSNHTSHIKRDLKNINFILQGRANSSTNFVWYFFRVPRNLELSDLAQ